MNQWLLHSFLCHHVGHCRQDLTKKEKKKEITIKTCMTLMKNSVLFDQLNCMHIQLVLAHHLLESRHKGHVTINNIMLISI